MIESGDVIPVLGFMGRRTLATAKSNLSDVPRYMTVKPPTKKLAPAALDRKERRIPVSASHAFSSAMKRTLAAGCSVVIASDGKLIQISPDGKRRQLKVIKKRVHVHYPDKTTIRWVKISHD